MIIHRGELLGKIVNELERSRTLHGNMNSVHEGYAVILEELNELWDEVRKKEPDYADMREEAIQIAAMALKFIEDNTYPDDIVIDADEVPEAPTNAGSMVLHHKHGTFRVGAPVRKIDGYSYLGVVVAIFPKRNHQIRVVVEATQHPYEGMLHIYTPENLMVIIQND